MKTYKLKAKRLRGVEMQAYEFITTPIDGVIKIPSKYRNKIKTSVKVIILEQESEIETQAKSATKKSDLLTAPAYDTTGWRFSREEANAR